MKKLLTIMLAMCLLLATMTVLAIPANAAEVEGDWVTSRAGDAYEEGVTDYTPAAGYKYTTEGFQTVAPDFTNCSPYIQAHTKKAYDLKAPNADENGNALSVKFTVQEFAYGGEYNNKDEWIAITLNSDPVVTQGNPAYGSGLCILIRGAGNGAATGQPHYSDKENNKFSLFTQGQINPTLNDDGQEEYTFSIKYDGTKYVMNLCGVEFSDPDGNLDRIFDEQCAEGAYLGITLMTTEIETPASFVITEFQGAVPYGEDSADPEANVKNFAEIADSSTVPAGQPAVIWDGKAEYYDKISISNADYTVQESGVVSLKANGTGPYISFNLKNDISYEASDFPIVVALTRNCLDLDGQMYYYSGRTLGANSDCLMDIMYDDYDFGEGWGLSVLDLTDDPEWEGRINGMRLDFKDVDYTDEETANFDVAFFGAFRTEEEAVQYAKDYLIALLGKMPETTEKPTEEPTTEAPTTEAKTDAPTEENPSEEATTDAEQSGGCKSVVIAPAVALIALLGVAFVAKKKD
ncbi:MAG: hypothetical protein IJF08_08440 [Clostridia bacterium]|nr:hypothetical protein [Clostridia bacterium]